MFYFRFKWAQLNYCLKEKLPWWIAYHVPRKVALFCFVRVYAILGTFSSDYEDAYKLWEKGIGK